MSFPSVWQPAASAISVLTLVELSGLTIPSPQPNGLLVYVESEDEYYRFSSTSGAAISSPNVLATQAGGTSRWLKTALLNPASAFQILLNFQLDITLALGVPTNTPVISNATCVGANILGSVVGGGVLNSVPYAEAVIQLDTSIVDANRRPFVSVVDDSGEALVSCGVLQASGLDPDTFAIDVQLNTTGVPDGTYTTYVTLGLV